jgi:hypothetical protein
VILGLSSQQRLPANDKLFILFLVGGDVASRLLNDATSRSGDIAGKDFLIGLEIKEIHELTGQTRW